MILIFVQLLFHKISSFLIPRNYKSSLINLEFDRVRGLPGDDFNERRRGALEKVEKEQKNNDRIIAPLDFNPHLPKASEIFRKHHKAMIFKAPHLSTIFPEPPMPAYRQPKNIRRLLCKSKLHPDTINQRLKRGTTRRPRAGKNVVNPARPVLTLWTTHQASLVQHLDTNMILHRQYLAIQQTASTIGDVANQTARISLAANMWE